MLHIVAAAALHDFSRKHGVTAGGHWRPGHDADGFAARHASVEGRARQRVADDLQWNPVVWRRTVGGIRNDGVAIHRGAVESRDIDRAGEWPEVDAANGLAARNDFRVE